MKSNALNAKQTDHLANKLKENVMNGTKEMEGKLSAINSIKQSSDNIANILKTIENIAFQTNLLALNATVEATRAGQHGKDFSVVAEEVRNLATRSKKAAEETSILIKDSVDKVMEGTLLANTTAQALNKIVENADEVSKLIELIAISSSEQAYEISQVSIGLSQISHVVRNNTATSEESATSPQELSSQSDTLKDMVERLSLKDYRQGHYK